MPCWFESSPGHIVKQIIYTDKAPEPIGPYSQAVLVNGFLFVSGQIAIDPATNLIVNSDIEREANRVMQNIEEVLSQKHISMGKNVALEKSCGKPNMISKIAMGNFRFV